MSGEHTYKWQMNLKYKDRKDNFVQGTQMLPEHVMLIWLFDVLIWVFVISDLVIYRHEVVSLCHPSISAKHVWCSVLTSPGTPPDTPWSYLHAFDLCRRTGDNNMTKKRIKPVDSATQAGKLKRQREPLNGEKNIYGSSMFWLQTCRLTRKLFWHRVVFYSFQEE